MNPRIKSAREVAMMFARQWGGGDRETEATIWHAVRAAIEHDRHERARD